jgi:hypothetical protein
VCRSCAGQLEDDLGHEDGGQSQRMSAGDRTVASTASTPASAAVTSRRTTSVSTSPGGVASWIVASPAMQSAVPAAAIQPISS